LIRVGRGILSQNRAEKFHWNPVPRQIDPPGANTLLQHRRQVNRWQKQFFENGVAAFEPRRHRAGDAKDRRITLLEQKLQRKNEVLSELMEEHVKLKKELGEL
jgi:hypothetical protein